MAASRPKRNSEEGVARRTLAQGLPKAREWTRENTLGIDITGSRSAARFTGRNFSIDPFGELGYERIFDLDLNAISLRGGLMLSGWMWK